MEAVNLKTEHMKNPIGLGISAPLLSWNCTNGILQTAFEVSASLNEMEVWNSGKVVSREMHCLYGAHAESRQRIQWRVRLWDENGVCGSWSESASFETAFLSNDLWSAKWIAPEGNINFRIRQPASHLKKRFHVDKAGTARLYITCHGIYAPYINGQRAGDFVLAPGTSEYHARLPYQTIDVTDLLHPGENDILVKLGDGWWRGGNGISGVRNLYGTKLALLCQLEVDGKSVLISDETWQASQTGPIRTNDLQLGEVYDANATPEHWHSVKIQDYGYENLICSNSVPIREQEQLTAKLLVTPNGEKVLDFGQNMAGYVEFRISAKQGQRIILTHGEMLDSHGNFSDKNIAAGRNRKEAMHQQIQYICKEGENHYKPEFCIFGFQYVKVDTDIDIVPEDFVAHAVYSDMAMTGSFTCSDKRVNKLVSNTLWSQKSNFCDIPTDCPTRERSGWSGDAGAFVETGLYLSDCYPVFRKWMAEFGAAQYPDGKASNVAPRCGNQDFFTKLYEGSTGWGDACILVPYALYRFYGDTRILEENYDTMKKWLQFSEKRAHKSRPQSWFKKNPYRKYTIDTGVHWGEWLEPDTDIVAYTKEIFLKGATEVATAYYSYSSRLFSEIARVLGKTADAEKYEKIAENARNAYRFTQLPKSRIFSERQCCYVRPLAMGLLQPEEAAQAAADLNELVIHNDYHLNTGFLSTPHLCRVLADFGYTETAYRLLLQNTSPSWLYAVEQGANTIWESWEGNLAETGNASLNHYSKGAVVAWLFDGVCGIKIKGQNVVIAPKPNRLLSFASAEYASPVGLIKSGWRYSDTGLEFKITVPANVDAKILLPDGAEYTVAAGNYHFCTKE